MTLRTYDGRLLFQAAGAWTDGKEVYSSDEYGWPLSAAGIPLDAWIEGFYRA